jgi:hypothetical protein
MIQSMPKLWTRRHIDELRRLPAIEHDRGGDENALPPDVIWDFYCAGILERPAPGRFTVTDVGMDLWTALEDLLTDENGLPRDECDVGDLIGYSDCRPTPAGASSSTEAPARALRGAHVLRPFHPLQIALQ